VKHITSGGKKDMRPLRIFSMLLLIGFLVSGLIAPREIVAEEEEQTIIGITPPRLGFIDGQVSFLRQGDPGWSPARVNTPIAAGDELSTGQSGNLELQIATGAYVRAAGNTRIGLGDHESGYIRFKVTEGHVSLDIRATDPGVSIEIDTPNAAFIIEHSGYYRLDVSGEHTSFSVYRSGEVVVAPAQGKEFTLSGNREVRLRGSESSGAGFYQAKDLDSWDRWCLSRTDSLLDAASVRYVSRDVYGLEDLDRAGTWENTPEYGPVWMPMGVPADWAPYSSGTWISDPVYGWSWVDAESWGWAPYHYGRWVSMHGRWAWAPGPPVSRPAYAPALVVFFGDTGNIGAGNVESVVGWMALGWGEPLVPWWGSVHHPWWGGWGGPRHREVEHTRRYSNMDVKHSMVVVKKSDFAHRPVKRLHVPAGKSGFGFGPVPPRTSYDSAGRKDGYSPAGRSGGKPAGGVVKRSVVTPHPKARHVEPSSRGQQFLGPKGSDEPSSGLIAPKQRVDTNRERFRKDTVKSSTGSSRNPVPKSSSVQVQRGKPSSEELLKRRRVQDSHPLEGPPQNHSFPSHRKDEFPP
jgi:Family of unknown function (DUF6600)